MADHGEALREDGLLLDELAHHDLLRQPTQAGARNVLSGRDDDLLHVRALAAPKAAVRNRSPDSVLKIVPSVTKTVRSLRAALGDAGTW